MQFNFFTIQHRGHPSRTCCPNHRSATVPGRSNVQMCNNSRFFTRLRADIAIFSPVLALGSTPSPLPPIKLTTKLPLFHGVEERRRFLPKPMRVRNIFICSGVAFCPSSSLHGQALDSDIDINLTEGTGMAAVASPDRRSIAIDLLGALWVLPIGGGEAKRVTPDTLEARRPSWAPDSRSIAFQGYGDAWHIYTIGIDGTGLKTITSGPFCPTSATSPTLLCCIAMRLSCRRARIAGQAGSIHRTAASRSRGCR